MTLHFIKLVLVATTSVVVLLFAAPAVQAGHVYAGIINTNGTPGLQAGDALAFVDVAAGTPVTGASLGLQIMPQALAGNYAGLYLTNGISFTALSNGRNWTGSGYRAVNSYAATAGSLIQMQIFEVLGPAGAEFSFWDEAVSTTVPVVTYKVGVGITLGSGYVNLTDTSLIVGDGNNDGIGEPPTATNATGTDPYGHIHGRNITVNVEGEYTVKYILHETDTVGAHPDSAPFEVSYGAVPEPAAAGLLAAAGFAFIAFRLRRAVR